MPEIADGLVEITNVAREPGYRSKIAVVSHADGVDPVGACVGPRGSRVRMVVSELRGEKIDIIPYNDEPARFVAKALSPARVREVLVDDDQRQATVDRAGRPALAGDRPRGPERPPRRAPDRLAHRHPLGDRVRDGRAGHRRTRRRRPAGAAPRSVATAAAARTPRSPARLLRPARPPGALALLGQLGPLHPGFATRTIARLSDPDLSQEDVADLVARGEEAYAAAAEEAAAAQAAQEAADAEAAGADGG